MPTESVKSLKLFYCYAREDKALRNDEALAASEQALRLDPHSANAWRINGSALYHLKRYDEALAAYECALHLNLSYTIAWYSKSLALKKLGRLKDARHSHIKTRQLGYEA